MNKKVLLGVAAFAIAAVSVFNVNFNSQSNNLSNVSLANVEQLAMAEDLPEVVISCNSNGFGTCYLSTDYYPYCTFSGYMSDFCYPW
ncbi:hypothetical protein FACS189426_01080 [Bacteroidia bacterium]|nr:hypothetical protein FACS189426_01080 [Bacteroidia bacterium]GHV71791.1 hypothetical protein FACS189420_7970 [Bacteroidia bacterium]